MKRQPSVSVSAFLRFLFVLHRSSLTSVGGMLQTHEAIYDSGAKNKK